ncbi:MAG: sugar ABC transporter permease [Phycisphaeraceae bacterium]|nr:sugar ABC transporter permease [Phycisphaeraceae bacterium]
MPRRSAPAAMGFLAFPLAVLLVFTLIPTALGVGLSLFQWTGGGSPRYIGSMNFSALLDDDRVGAALRNSLIYVLATVPLTTIAAFLVASAVHARWFRGRAAVRTLLFLPTIVSIVAIGFVWRWLLNDRAGLVSPLLRALGVAAPPRWLEEGPWPMVCIILVSIWRQIGFCVVIYLSALAALGASVDEAAELDGATGLRRLRHVTFPRVSRTTVFLLATGAIGALQVFDIVYVMTAGEPTRASTVLNYEVYRNFSMGSLGFASAIGVLLLALTAMAGALQFARRRGAAS